MSKIVFFLLFISCISFSAEGQKRNNVWVFGNHAGIDFNNTPPTALDYTAVTNEDPYPVPHFLNNYYTASICDSTGNLLFYTDGIKVWDKRDMIIPRYLGRWPWSLYTIPLICPYPNNDSLYYIFGVSNGSYANRLQYLTINMKGNGGLGKIVYPMPSTLDNYFSVLLTGASVLLAGTLHCNGKDTWIVSYSGDSFYCFLLTENGINPDPVVSRIPLSLQSYEGSNIKFSASGEKLIFPQKDNNQVVVVSFDKATGIFSKPVQLNIPADNTLEDAEISPDGTKLYFGCYTTDFFGDDGTLEWHYLYQMDLDAATPDAIEKTATPIKPVPDRLPCNPYLCYTLSRTLQLGPDGAIYANLRDNTGQGFDTYVGIISDPNEPALQSGYNRSFLDLKRECKSIKYNYIRSGSYSPKQNLIQSQKAPCSDKPVQFSLLYQNIDSVKWNFGDAASGADNYSSSFKPSHIYPSPGTYNVSVVLFSPCFSDTAYSTVTITNLPSVKIPPFPDTTICVGSNYIINVTIPDATRYEWENGQTNPVRKIDTSGYYTLKVFNECSIDTSGFSVKFLSCDCTFFVPTAFTPNNDGLNDRFKPISKCFAKDYLFKIYNRYGQLVFSTSQLNKGWDGTLGNVPAATGTFVWVLQYRDPNNNQFFKRNGTVVLIR